MFSKLYKLFVSPRANQPGPKRRSRVRLGIDLLEDRLTPSTFVVTNLDDAAVPPARGMDLRQAVAAANNAPGSLINFSVSGTILLNQGELKITQPVTIDGTGQAVAIDAQAKSRVFFINTPYTVNINNLTIKNGNTTTNGVSSDGLGNGGGIDDTSPSSILNLTGDQIEINTAAPTSGGGNGGGVYTNGVVMVTSSLVEANTAPGGEGGGIYAGANITLNSTIVSNNSALTGGGIYQAGTGTTVTLNDSTVTTNLATSGNGGGIWAFFNVVVNTVTTGSNVSNNDALGGGNGGGIYSQEGNVNINGANVIGNLATGQGGGIWAQFDIILSAGANVNNNIGDTGGGGIWSNVGFVKLFGSMVMGNNAGQGVSATGNGGGIVSGTDVTIDAMSTVTGNTANGNGGGIYANRNVTLNGGTVSLNAAISSLFNGSGNPTNGIGGGIYALVDVVLNKVGASVGTVTLNIADLSNGGVFAGGTSNPNLDTSGGGTDTNNDPQP